VSIVLTVIYKPQYRKYSDQGPTTYEFKTQAEADQFLADYAGYLESVEVSE
jgi:hypothetical protein